MIDILLPAALGGMGIALIAGPLGSMVIWRRMAYFGDTLAHSTLLGVNLSLLLRIHPYLGVSVVCLFITCTLMSIKRSPHLTSDAILGILAHSTLSLGLIFATFIKGVRMDLLEYLYGDILAITREDLYWILSVNIIGFIILAIIWKPLLSILIEEELAMIEGVPVQKVKWLFMILMALVFAIAMKLVGALLITALFIIPASAAYYLSNTPEKMAIFASVIGMMAVLCGLLLSYYVDWPAGPAMVVMAASFFVMSRLYYALLSSYV